MAHYTVCIYFLAEIGGVYLISALAVFANYLVFLSFLFYGNVFTHIPRQYTGRGAMLSFKDGSIVIGMAI
jgi:hypothetical protein